MYIVAFFLMIISITKLLILGSTTWEDIENADCKYPNMIKPAMLMLALDALMGLSCSLWILL